ncbi:hypothetical protein [Streptomyces sp. NPDC014894]|uniref:hypothetical protein n=1 Tax=Streptomyces sp. NPDC014894 TaxID=3364931 RepID=UPI0036FADB54
MRLRISAVVVTGAVALTGFAAPAVQADEKPSGASAFKAAGGSSAFAAAGARKPSDDITEGDTKISNVVFNAGKPVVIGAAKSRRATVAFTAADPSGIKSGVAGLWRGTDIGNPTSTFDTDEGEVPCGAGVRVTCKLTFAFDPDMRLRNSMAGAWKLAVGADAKDQDFALKTKAKTISLQREARISVNAAPEPVKKGKKLTVTGSLKRADWETGAYTGYTKQPVKLQFRKKGAKTFTTVKTVRTDAKGALRTTVKATADGTYRYNFAGTSTTAPVTNGGDYVDVR